MNATMKKEQLSGTGISLVAHKDNLKIGKDTLSTEPGHSHHVWLKSISIWVVSGE